MRARGRSPGELHLYLRHDLGAELRDHRLPLLAADGLSGGSPASKLFTQHDAVLPVGFEADADADVSVNDRD